MATEYSSYLIFLIDFSPLPPGTLYFWGGGGLCVLIGGLLEFQLFRN